MKLISLNIEKDRHFKEIIEFYKKEKPDVFCVQELLEKDVDLLKKELGMDCIFQACRYETKSHYSDSIGLKQGVAIFSKNIVASGSIFYFGNQEEIEKEFNPEIKNNSEALVWADIKDSDGEVYRYLVVHLPVTFKGESSPLQLEALDGLFKKLDPLGEFVLCGDMNAPRGGETFTRLAKKYKDNIPPTYTTSIDKNLHRVGPEKFIPEGMQYYMVDGLFTTHSYKASSIKLVDGLSDHMAVVGEISK